MGAGASSDSLTKTEAMDCLGGEWDEAMETRFMYSADAKTGTVNRKAAQRVLAKAERCRQGCIDALPARTG